MNARIIFGLLISLLVASPAFSQNSRLEGLTDREIKLLYGEFKTVRTFGLIAVSLVGDAAQFGLTADTLKNRIKEQFKNDFCSVEYRDLTEDPQRFAKLLAARDPHIGSITFRIWVVGDTTALAYHVRCDAGTFRNFSIWSEEVLGHGTKESLPHTIDDILAEMMKQLSVNFFTARDEKCK